MKIPNEITKISYFIKLDASAYNNFYKYPEIKFYDITINKGYPAIVPFNRDEGWYIAPLSYDDSGRVNSFYLCNVGINGLQEEIQDDICQRFEGGKYDYSAFNGLQPTKVANLISQGKDALEKVQTIKSRTAGDKVRINGVDYKIGTPKTGTVSTQCQDLMSPKDCSTLFNVVILLYVLVQDAIWEGLIQLMMLFNQGL